jgi:hypothetical protein
MNDISSKMLLQKDIRSYKVKENDEMANGISSLDHCLIGWLKWELDLVKETRQMPF